MTRLQHILLSIFLLLAGCGMIAISLSLEIANPATRIFWYGGLALYFISSLYVLMLIIFSSKKRITSVSADTTVQYTRNKPAMKQNTIRLVFPLALTLVIWVTVVRHVLLEDGYTPEFTGFPFSYTGGLCGTSMCKNFYILELLGDCLLYAAVLYMLVWACYKWIAQFKVPKYIAAILWAPVVLWAAFWAFFTIYTTDASFYLYCDYAFQEVVDIEWEVFGYRF